MYPRNVTRILRRLPMMGDSVRLQLSQALLLLLAICFALQTFSPLRLNTDSTVLLSMGESAAHGDGFLDSGHRTIFPPGYPALLAILLKLGIAHPWVIVGLNLAFLSVGLYAVYSLLVHDFFADRVVVLIICSFFLLSYVVVKHFTIALTDIPFFCFSMCCLSVMSQTVDLHSNYRFAKLAAAAWLLAAVAITVRTIGVALFLPLVFMFLSRPQSKLLLKNLSHRTKLIIVVVTIFAGAGGTYVFTNTPYWRILIGIAEKSNISTLILQILSFRLTELGELFGNLPLTKMPAKLHAAVPWMGLLLVLLTLSGLAIKRRKISATEVFLLCYTGILFAWPYNDTRFWLPIIPLLTAYSVLAVKSLRFPRAVVVIYCIVFAVLGFSAIVYSSRISLAGSKFPDEYGDGYLRPTYCAALKACQDGFDPNKVNAKALRLLQEYK